MADLPETLTITVNIPPSNVFAGSTVQAISTIGMGVPGLAGPPPTITNGTIATGAPGSAAILTFTPIAAGVYRVDGSIPEGEPGLGTGDVVGPAGATDSHVALFNGATGKLLKSGGALGTAASKNTGTAAGNVPVLDGSGLLDTAILPALAVSDIFVVASQAAMLALSAQRGDIAIRTDLNKSFALSTNAPGTLADWKELLTPTDLVLSVAGLTGSVSAAALKSNLAIASGDVSGLGTAATKNTGTAAGNVVLLDGSAKLPAVDGSQLTNLPASSAVPVVTKSGAYTVVAGDAGKLIECTATLTLSLTAAATLGAGFKFYVRLTANGGAVTLDPSGSELIDGIATVAGYIGDGVFEVICDGTSFRTGRKKGPTLITKMTIGAPAASADFEAAFGDAEMIAINFELSAIAISDSFGQLTARVKKSGSYQTSNYIGAWMRTSAGSLTTAPINTSYVDLTNNYNGSGNQASGRFSITGIRSAAAGGQLLSGDFMDSDQSNNSGSFGIARVMQTTPATAEGIRFLSSGGTVDGGTIHQYGVRA